MRRILIAALEVLIDRSGGLAALGDGPHHERLPAAHIARGKDSIDGGHVVGIGRDVAALSSARPNCSIMPLRTGPRKPIASSTRSTSMVNSEPAIGSNLGGGPTRTACKLLHVAVLVAGEAGRC